MIQDPRDAAVDDFRMSILDHLRELRRRLMVGLGAMLAGVMVCALYANEIFGWLVEPMNRALTERGEGTMAITDPIEGAVTYLKVALIAGGLVASPVVFHQAWSFVAPGLYHRERRLVLPLAAASTVLFLAGGAFGYYVMFDYGFSFFLSMAPPDQTSAVLSIDSYLGTATKLLLAFGGSFELPVVVFFLARMGLIDHRDMVQWFRYSIVGIFIVAAVITPPDPLSQTLMAIPLTVLYALSIGVAWAFTTKKRDQIATSST